MEPTSRGSFTPIAPEPSPYRDIWKEMSIFLALTLFTVVSAISVYSYNRFNQINQNNQISQLPTPSIIPVSTLVPEPTIAVTLAPTRKPTPITPTLKPTAIPTIAPTATPTPATTCVIVPLFSTENSLAIDFYYSAQYSATNKYVSGFRMDFNGDGSWDTDFALPQKMSYAYPSAGTYNPKMQIRMSDGETSPVCSRSVTVPNGTTVSLNGQVFEDVNCNGVKDSGDEGISGVTVNIFKMPEFSLYSSVISGSNGNYSLTRVVGPNDSLSLQPGDVASPSHNIRVDAKTVVLSASQSSVTVNLPQVPSSNINLCSN